MAEVSQINTGNTIYYMRDRNYCTCETAANTVAKTASLTGFALIAGAIVHVKFTYSNTASSPTLNINSTGAKAIMKYGSTAVGTTENTSWYAGAILTLVYDGTNWIISDYTPSVGGTVDTAMSDSSTNAVENRVIKSYIDQLVEEIAISYEEIPNSSGGNTATFTSGSGQ